MTTDTVYEWSPLKGGHKLPCPELRMTIYVMNVKKKWIGIIQADYDKDYVYRTKKYSTMADARSEVVNILIGGLASIQLKLLQTIVDKD